jgi:hypothetical protein
VEGGGGGSANATTTPSTTPQTSSSGGSSKGTKSSSPAAAASSPKGIPKVPLKSVKVGTPGKGPGYQKGHFTGNFFGPEAEK